VIAATGSAGATCARGRATGATCRGPGRVATAERVGALNVLWGFTAAGNDTQTCVVVGVVAVGSGPRLASWEPSKIAGSANEAPTAPVSSISTNARRTRTLMANPLTADILLREGLRQAAAEA
jgi:hypothetical protein